MDNTETKIVGVEDNKQEFKNFLSSAKRFSATYIRFFKELEQELDVRFDGKLKLQSKTKSQELITGVSLSKVITKSDGEFEYSGILTDYSLPGSISSMEAETILGFSVGIGHVKYEDGRTFYGFINLKTKLPTLAGVWNDSDGENLKLEYGIEYSESIWSNTPRALDGVINFFMEGIQKSVIEREIFEKWLFPVFAAKDDGEIHNIAEKIAKVTLTDSLLTAVDYTELLGQFNISINQFPQEGKDLIYSLEKNGSYVLLLEEHLKDLIQTSAHYFTSTGTWVYPIDMLSTSLVPNTPPNSEIHNNLVESKMFGLSDRIFVSGVRNLNELEVFVKEKDSLELKKLENIGFSIRLVSPTGKSSYIINNRTDYDDFIVKARRWEYYYLDVFLVGDVQSSFLLSIRSSKVNEEVINRLYS